MDKVLVAMFAAVCAALARADVTVTAAVFDPRFDDTVKVTDVNGIEKTAFATGEDVKITVNLFGETVYKRWEGLPTNAVVEVRNLDGVLLENPNTNRTGTVTATFKAEEKGVAATVYTAPVWYWLPNAEAGYTTNGIEIVDGVEVEKKFYVVSGTGLLSNRVWRLHCRPTNTGATTLRIGAQTACGYTDYGDGILDLSGPLVPQNYVITQVGASGATPLAPYNKGRTTVGTTNRLHTLVIPETMTDIPEKMFTAYSGERYSSLTNLIIVSTNLKTIGRQSFYGSKIGALTLKTPNLERFPSDSAFTSIKLGGYDASNFDLSSLTNFAAGGFSMAGLSGVYRLPKLLTANWVLQHPHESKCSLEIGTDWMPEDAAVLSFWKIENNGAKTNSLYGVREYNGSVTFGPYADIEGNPAAIFNSCGVTNLMFLGAPFPNAQKIIASAYDKKGKYGARIYASKYLGWRAYVDTDLTDDEKTRKAAIDATLTPPQKVLGIFRDQANSRKAWIIHNPSPYDPPPGGVVIIIR